MKKLVAGMVMLFCLLQQGSAQTENWYFSLTMGASVPVNNFLDNTPANKKSGYANNGFALVLDATYPFGEHWSFKGMAMLNTNSIDKIQLGRSMEITMEKYIPAVTGDDRRFLNLGANSWINNGLLAGPVYTVHLKRLYLDLQALGGMNVAYLLQPKLRYQKPTNNWIYVDQNTNTTNVAFGVLAGAALRFPLADRVNFKVGFDYYHAQATLKNEQIRVTQNGTTYVQENLGTTKTNVPIDLLTATIGFVYYLN